MRLLATENENITIEYKYVQKVYEISNTIISENPVKTQRKEAKDALNVLKILIPTTSITLDTLKHLATDEETIKEKDSIEYIYDKDLFYLKSFIFNGYEDYSLQIDPEKAVILITNSNLVFDLTLSESLSERFNQIKYYYYSTLKLNIPIELVAKLYELLLNSYKPQVVNEIEEKTNKVTQKTQLVYSTTAILNNFSKEALSEYYIKKSLITNTNLNRVAEIDKVDNTTNTIHLLQPPTREVNIGDTIQLFNTKNTVLNQEFSNDGSYTVEDIISDTEIKIDGILPITYTTPMPTLYALYSIMNISSSSTNSNTIVVDTSITNEFSIGDEIQVLDTTVKGEYGSTSTIDGIYTIREINGSTLYVNEPISFNYNYDSSYEAQGIVFKKTSLGSVKSIENEDTYSIVTLIQEPEFTLKTGSTGAIIYTDGEFKLCKVARTSTTPNRINLEDSKLPETPIKSFETEYGELRKDFLDEIITLYIEKSSNEELLPKGEFTLLNSIQCNEYLKLISSNTLPSTQVYDNMGKVVEEYKTIDLGTTEYQIKMRGLSI